MAGQDKKVAIRGLTTAVASKPVNPGEVFPLSVLDHLMGFHSLRLVFYYRSDPDDFNCPLRLTQLRESLAETLALYPVVTGRLRRDEEGNWEVKYSDTGVRLRLASVKGSVEEWLRSATAEEEKELTYWEEMPEDPHIWSPYQLQINEFERGGVAIGLTLTHIHADPVCATLLMKAWSEHNRRIAIAHPPFCLVPALRGRTNRNTDTQSVRFYESKLKAQPPPGQVKMLSATFQFPESSVKSLLSEVYPHSPEATPFDALAALFWSRTVHYRAVDGHEHSLTVGIDFKKLMHAPLPHGFYGNAMHFSKVSVEGAYMEDDKLGNLAGAIRRHLSEVKEEEYWSVIDWVESRRDPQGKFPPPFQMYGPELTCVNLEHVFAYGAMFADNVKPLHVGYHVEKAEGEGLILVLPSPEEGLGRTVSVTLPENQLAKVYQDEAILRLSGTLVISDKR